jgi:Cu(I)/Ag(I) efflux system periplasmic protein CusF
MNTRTFATHTTLLLSLALGALTAVATAATAQTTEATTATASAGAEPAWSQAVVRRVDPITGKVSLKHGEIRNLDMPPMSMVFTATPPSQLQGIAVGDTVRFVADDVDGVLVVTRIEVQR